MRVVIIGGGSAGTALAFELRKIDKNAEVVIIDKSSKIGISPCSFPYIISGEIKNSLIFTKKDYENNNIKLLLNSRAVKIDKHKKIVYYKTIKQDKKIAYDKLVIATGSQSFVPNIKGIKNDFFTLKTLNNALKINKNIKKSSKSVIIGAGMIGVELAQSLAKRKEKVILIESKNRILSSFFDTSMAGILKKVLEAMKIKIYENEEVKEVGEKVIVLKNKKLTFDKLFLCTGVKAGIELAKETGLVTGKGIIVNDFLETSDKHIYACGDCTESVEFTSNNKILSQLGTTAARQAMIIARNITGGKEKFSPVMNNVVTKVGEKYAGAVGLTFERAKELGIKSVSAEYTGSVRAEYHPSKSSITARIVCDYKGVIIGSQIIGDEEVIGRLNLMALIVQKKLKVDELSELETCYNPASAPIFDPLTITAGICLKKLNAIKKKV